MGLYAPFLSCGAFWSGTTVLWWRFRNVVIVVVNDVKTAKLHQRDISKPILIRWSFTCALQLRVKVCCLPDHSLLCTLDALLWCLQLLLPAVLSAAYEVLQSHRLPCIFCGLCFYDPVWGPVLLCNLAFTKKIAARTHGHNGNSQKLRLLWNLSLILTLYKNNTVMYWVE